MANEFERNQSGSTLTSGAVGGGTLGTGAASRARGARIIGVDMEDKTDAGPGPSVMAAATLEGNDVKNQAGEKLGTIDQIMLDVGSGQIAYAVLSSGGFLGMGDKLFAIPWNALTLDTDSECFILDITKERLENAPGFDQDSWPSMADQSWASETYAYYGTQPYWTDMP